KELVAPEVVAFAVADIAGDEQHSELPWMRGLQVPDQLGPGHLGHDHVADDEVELLRLEQLYRFRPARAGDGLVIQILERADGRGAHAGVVLDEQDAGARHPRIRIGELRRRADADRRRRFGPWQIDGDGGAAPDLALDPDLAARLVGEAENLRQAEP